VGRYLSRDRSYDMVGFDKSPQKIQMGAFALSMGPITRLTSSSVHSMNEPVLRMVKSAIMECARSSIQDGRTVGFA